MRVDLLACGVLALALFAAPAAADEWFVAGQDEDAVVLVDRSSIQRNGQEIIVSTMAVPPAGTQKRGITFIYRITTWSVNCGTMAGYLRNQTDYDADEKRIEYNALQIYPRPVPAPFPTDTDQYTALSMACTGRWGDAPALPTTLAAYRLGLERITRRE